MRRPTIALALAPGLLLFAAVGCGRVDKRTPPTGGGAGGSGGGGGEPVPTHPVFAGLTSAVGDPVDANSVILRWSAATDDVTPPEALVYTLHVLADDPRRGDPGQDVTYDVSGLVEFRYSGMPAEDVRWFYVEVEDEDGEKAGAEVILPAVKPTVAPTLAAPEPAEATVEATVQVQGAHLLDEPTAEGSATLGGVPIPRENITQWSNNLLTFTVPEGAVSGPIVVTTPFGQATSTAELTIR